MLLYLFHFGGPVLVLVLVPVMVSHLVLIQSPVQVPEQFQVTPGRAAGLVCCLRTIRQQIQN